VSEELKEAQPPEQKEDDCPMGCRNGYMPDAAQAWDIPGHPIPECPWCRMKADHAARVAELEAERDALKAKLDKAVQARESVKNMAQMMEAQLRRNEHRGGWDNCCRAYFLEKLEINLRDLRHNLDAGLHAVAQRDCADIANFSMMLAENERREHPWVLGYTADGGDGMTTQERRMAK
jgi:hypothetical protein